MSDFSSYIEDIFENFVIVTLDEKLLIKNANKKFIELTGIADSDIESQQIDFSSFVDIELLNLNRNVNKKPIFSFKKLIEASLESEDNLFCYLRSKVYKKSIPVTFHCLQTQKRLGYVVLVGKKNTFLQQLKNEYYNNMPFTMYAHDLNEKILYLDSGAKFIGIDDPKSLIGKSLRDLLEEQSLKITKRKIKEWKNYLDDINDEEYFDKKALFDKHTYPLSVNILPPSATSSSSIPIEIFNRAFRISGKDIVVGLARNVNEERKSISKLFATFEQTTHPIYRYKYFPGYKDRFDRFRFTYINNAFLRFLEYDSKDELVGQSIFKVFREDDLKEILNIVEKRYFLEIIETAYDYKLVTKSGKIKDVNIHAFPFIFHSNEPLFVQGSLHDLGKEKKYLKDLEAINLRLTTMVEAFEVIDSDLPEKTLIDEILSFSSRICHECVGAFFEIIKYDSYLELIPTNYLNLNNKDVVKITIDENSIDFLTDCFNNLSFDIRNEVKSSLIDAFPDFVGEIDFKNLYVIPVGSEDSEYGLIILLSFSDTKINDAGQATLRYFSNIISARLKRDQLLDEEKLIIENLESTSKQITLGELSWEVTHEIGNFVNAINTTAILSLRDKTIKEGTDLHEHLTNIDKRVADAKNILNRFRRWYSAPGDISDIDSNDLISEVIEIYKSHRRVRKKDIKIRFDNIKKNLPLVRISRLRLKEVLSNIVINAIQAIPEREKMGKIIISTRSDSKTIYIDIKDNGSGIKPNDFRKIFTNWSGRKEGTGFGLYVSKRLIKESGGDIEVKNNPHGKGARFTIWLPYNIEEI